MIWESNSRFRMDDHQFYFHHIYHKRLLFTQFVCIIKSEQIQINRVCIPIYKHCCESLYNVWWIIELISEKIEHRRCNHCFFVLHPHKNYNSKTKNILEFSNRTNMNSHIYTKVNAQSQKDANWKLPNGSSPIYILYMCIPLYLPNDIPPQTSNVVVVSTRHRKDKSHVFPYIIYTWRKENSLVSRSLSTT